MGIIEFKELIFYLKIIDQNVICENLCSMDWYIIKGNDFNELIEAKKEQENNNKNNNSENINNLNNNDEEEKKYK